MRIDLQDAVEEEAYAPAGSSRGGEVQQALAPNAQGARLVTGTVIRGLALRREAICGRAKHLLEVVQQEQHGGGRHGPASATPPRRRAGRR